MVVLRFVFRFIIFIIALSAIGVIFWSAYSFLQNNEANDLVIVEGNATVGRSPENLEDLARNVILQARAEEINTPLSNDATEIDFVVQLGETATQVGDRLQELGLITDAQLFRQFMQYNGLDSTLEAGDYVLRRNMSMKEIGEALQKASFEEVEITIPEGLRAEEIAEILSENNIMDGTAFLEAVRLGSIVSHPLLSDRPAGRSYEGYLFPDTYRLPARAKPEDLIQRMLDNLASKLPANTFDLASRQGLTLYQIMTVASIVEREAVIADERPTIASVYLNRIKADMYLQADPTVQYAMGYQPEADQWWKTPVTLEEYQTVDSPYNTYLTPGLPPGPIANAGINAIVATLEPAQTNYLFFVAFENGAHVFAETFEEHEKNVAVYQGQ